MFRVHFVSARHNKWQSSLGFSYTNSLWPNQNEAKCMYLLYYIEAVSGAMIRKKLEVL